MTNTQKAHEFLRTHGMHPELDMKAELARFRVNMDNGLRGQIGPADCKMLPAYVTVDGQPPLGKKVLTLDAGGTNLRAALVSFTEQGAVIEGLRTRPVPGVGAPITREDFLREVAEFAAPLAAQADRLGFCFSYPAEILPDGDGKVIEFSKEVVVKGSAGMLVCRELLEVWAHMGIQAPQTFAVVNDTVAALLGGASTLDKSAYSGFIGQISGTGTNTCTSVPRRMIEKLGLSGEQGMLINLESGLYDGIENGDFDLLLDERSNNPGLKFFEKKTAGVYLGELCHLMLLAAGEEGLLSPGSTKKIQALGRIDSAVIDAWSQAEGLEQASDNGADAAFVQELSLAMFQRSARCMCTNLLAIALLTGAGKDKPVCVCAEGSLVQRSRYYRPTLEALLESEGREKLGLHFQFHVGSETTLPGSAAAALLNC